MQSGQTTRIRQALASGELPAIESLQELDDRVAVIQLAMDVPHGRRWLRSLSDLDQPLAEQLLAVEDDFRSKRRDTTLANVVAVAGLNALRQHRYALAAGSAAAVFWNRLADDRNELMQTALDVLTNDDAEAAESTLYLLVLDPLDPYELGAAHRSELTTTALRAGVPATRTLAAEYLYDHDLPALAGVAPDLVLDDDERIRGLAWSAGFHTDPRRTFDDATDILGNETEPMPARRSALAAIGTHLPTSEVIEILAYFTNHPDEQLALDAANLLYRLHRHPTIATAAAESPHQSVREIAEWLLDPYRGSPAAGGSRPGDPTGSDIFAELIRQTEERAIVEDDEP